MDRTTPGSKQTNARNEERLRSALLLGLGGDAAAYHRFLQQLTGHLRAYLRRRLFNWPDDVEDIVQDTLLAVHNQRHTYQPEQPLTAWVQAIAKYKLIDLLRARSGREALHDPLDDDLAVFAASDTDVGDARRDLQVLMAALPERQRLAIVHVKLHGLTIAETSQRTGMSESAVKVNIHRGLKALAERSRSRP